MPQDPTPDPDVVVIGGGIIGLCVAWRAAQRGLAVRVLERGELGSGASRVAAGMLAPVTEADPGELALLELGLRSAEAWPAFAAELERASGLDSGLRRCGALVVARDRDEAEALEPALAPTIRLALGVPGDHATDPRATVTALAEAGRHVGVDLSTGVTVQRIQREGARIVGVRLTGGAVVATRRVVVAGGAWSGAIEGLPAIALRPVKGQILRLRDPSGPGLLDRIVRFEGGYLVPRGDGRYVLGATMEERGFDETVTAGGVYELLRDAGELVPGIHELVVEECSAGLRPATPDNAPLLGADAEIEGLVWATGHHRNGILLAPVTADLVVAALEGAAPPAAFAARRFEKVAA